MSTMSPLLVLASIVAAWACVIAWLVRGRAHRWIKTCAFLILASLTAAFFVPAIQRAKHDANLVEMEKRSQEQELNAMLREERPRR
jgi:multisubunit Na+/H+ antiporter MnhG subunit